MKSFVTELIETDDGTGDAILQFPEEFTKEQDWREGDTIDIQLVDGKIILRNLDLLKRESLSK